MDLRNFTTNSQNFTIFNNVTTDPQNITVPFNFDDDFDNLIIEVSRPRVTEVPININIDVNQHNTRLITRGRITTSQMITNKGTDTRNMVIQNTYVTQRTATGTTTFIVSLNITIVKNYLNNSITLIPTLSFVHNIPDDVSLASIYNSCNIPMVFNIYQN